MTTPALAETIRIHKAVYEVIEAHGGRPAAFAGGAGVPGEHLRPGAFG